MATLRSRNPAVVNNKKNDENGKNDLTIKSGVQNIPIAQRRNALTVVNENIQRRNATKKPLASKKPNPAQSTLGGTKGILREFKSNGPTYNKPVATKFTIFQDGTSENQENIENEVSISTKSLVSLKNAESTLVPMQSPESSDTICLDSPMVLDSSYEQTKTETVESDIWYLSSVYSKDIYTYLRDLEEQFRPKSSYIRKQPDITSSMRSILVDWLVEVTEEYNMHNETLYLAVSYLDRFLSSMSVMRSKLQLVGTASMFIASKYEEIYPPELKDFVYITDDTYTKKQLLRMEHLILKALSFDLSAPTAHLFLEHFCFAAKASEKVTCLAKYICELTLLEAEPFLAFLPSMTAASAICLANYTLGQDLWDDQIAEISGYQLEDFAPCLKCVFEKYRNYEKYPQQAMKEKYRSNKYHNVSTIKPPSSFIY